MKNNVIGSLYIGDGSFLSDAPQTPIAIVGMAFRLPGDLTEPDALWQVLADSRDMITHIPADRWSTAELVHPKRSEPGRSICFAAGVLSNVDAFDTAFFGISPREAGQLDPQQGLLLELAWEAMENASIPASALAGSDCAVYTGISGLDYGTRMLDDLAAMSSHFMTGNTLSLAANRLSYAFDLRGPSLAVDTACSSALVALHHACRALHAGDAGMAMVGGVNLLLHPYPFVGFSKAAMLSPDGRCKPFDAAGNGYVRAEGGVVMLLKPLDRAIADGDRIEAVILGSGANADGKRKSGITIPSHAGQMELMRAVLAKSGLAPGDVDFIEAHGTGTSVGDPIECAAIGEVYGQGRQGPLPIGSVKGNLGHLEPASGLVGLVKAVLALQHRQLPPQLHFDRPNPHIDFAGLNLQPVTRNSPLTKRGALVAGVNSFGFGGANAHVLVQEYGVPTAAGPVDGALPAMFPLLISARSETAVRELAARYARRLADQPRETSYDIAYAAATRRDRLSVRLGMWIEVAPTAPKMLEACARGEPVPGVVVEQALATSAGAPAPGIAFVYAGNGAQWVGMGRRLLQESPRFAASMAALDARMQPAAGISVLAELHAPETASRLDDTLVAQPVLFAIQVAITELLLGLGVRPRAVTGHSVGEIAAAWASGALDLDSAIQVIIARSRTQALTRGTGRMAAIGLSAADTHAALEAAGPDCGVVIAGINSPRNVTVSGDLDALQRLQARLPTGAFFRLLDLDYAFHSPAMDPIRERLLADLAALPTAASSRATFISTVTGAELDRATLATARYWWGNVRQPVRFDQAVAALHASGCRVFIEIGPHAILQRYLQETLASVDAGAGATRVLASLRKDADGWEPVCETALRALLLAELDQSACFPRPGRSVRLPNNPWQRERHWHARTTESSHVYDRPRSHPLLGWRSPQADWLWENTLDPLSLPWLADHRVGGAIVFPAAGYVELALAAARAWRPDSDVALEELDIVAPLVFDGEHARSLRCELDARTGGFHIRSRQRLTADEWTLHAAGRLLQHCAPAPRSAPAAFPDEGAAVDRQTHYRQAAALGLDYGPAFQTVHRVTVSHDQVQAELHPPTDPDWSDYVLHPGVLDGCFQALVTVLPAGLDVDRAVTLLPVKVGAMHWHAAAGAPVRCIGRVVRRSLRSVVVDYDLLDADDSLCARLTGCRFRAAPLVRPHHEAVPCWRIDHWLQPHPADAARSWLPPTPDLLVPIRQALGTPDEQRGVWHRETLPLLEALTTTFVFEAVQAIAADGPSALQTLLASPDPYVRWAVQLLQEEDLLASTADGWHLAGRDALPPAAGIWRSLIGEHPEVVSHLVLLGRVCRHLPRVLQDPAARSDMLRSVQRAAVPDGFQVDDLASAGIAAALSACLARLGAGRPPNRRLRVLDISPAPPAALRGMLAGTAADAVDYVLAMPPNAADRCRGEWLHHHNLVITTVEPDALRLPGLDSAARFDVIIVRHHLHRAAHPTAALAGLARLLAADGCLLLAESHPARWADLLGGLDPAWWVDNRGVSTSSLKPPATWEELLRAEGCTDVTVQDDAASGGMAAGAYLVVARRAHSPDAAIGPPRSATWWLWGDAATAAWTRRVQQRLLAQGQRASLAEGDQDVPPPAVQHIVYCRGWDAAVSDVAQQVQALVALVQGLARIGDQPPRLWVVTRGGALAGAPLPATCAPRPVQGALWGLGRVVMNELPALQCTLIDIAGDPEQAVPRLERELLQPDAMRELVLTDDARHSLVMREDQDARRTAAPSAAAGRFRLDTALPGQLRHLHWVQAEQLAMGEDEVEVRVHAAGLNFRDVMYAMGMLPDEFLEKGFAGAALGLECAGIVTRVGARVGDLQPGDRVMGFGPACLSSHVVTRPHALAPMPPGWSFVSAATVPTVFFTVYYALKQLADLQPGERVLIHGGAGGVGIAAIQLAIHLGAEVFATAGSDDKRDFVMLLGADHVFDSRSLAFADEILAITGGQGVDVVLNSLAGEAMRRSIAVVKPFGRFLELGKRDFCENTPVGLRPFKDNISYFGIDADQLLTARPQLASRLFGEVMALFRGGVLTPLPARVFEADGAVDAFRTMQQARHIGKVVLRLDAAPAAVGASDRSPASSPQLGGEAWLVTGGLSGFGLACARWLTERGVKHLALLGRRGADTPGADAAVAGLRALGATVQVVACDVADAAAVRQVFSDVRQRMPPLTGVLHAAAVFDDALLPNLTPERVRAVLAPKLLGAWHLHEASLQLPLRHFVVFSSVTTLIGNPGQGNYVAANAGLETLAAMRRASGLPATCLCWGPIGDVGYLTRNEAVRNGLAQRLGRPPLSVQQALAQLDIHAPRPHHTAPAAFDWPTLARVLPSASTQRFALLNRGVDRAAPDADEDLLARIAGMPAEDVLQLVSDWARAAVAEILAIAPERIDPAVPLHGLGLDSLMAVELTLELERRFGVQLPVMMLNDAPTVEKIARHITGKLLREDDAPGPADGTSDLLQAFVHQHGETAGEVDAPRVLEDAKALATQGARLIG